MIKAITFDFWQTLYEPPPVDYDERLRFLQIEVEQGCGVTFEQTRFEAAVKVARDTWNRVWVEEQRTLTAHSWLSIALQYLNVSLEPDYLFEVQTRMENSILDHVPTLVPEARETLAHLSARYRLAIISDTGLTPGRVLRQILEADNLTGYFSCLTFSDEIGRSKPHSDAFLTTLQALGAEPAEAVHVGDLLRTDIAGAQAVGMRGVQYVGVSLDNHSIVTPDAIIHSHAELVPLLQSWSLDPS